jgi:hypothetical protein
MGVCTCAADKRDKPTHVDLHWRLHLFVFKHRVWSLEVRCVAPRCCRRLVSCGWDTARAWDMDTLYKWHLDPVDKSRMEALEVSA